MQTLLCLILCYQNAISKKRKRKRKNMNEMTNANDSLCVYA